MIAIVSDIHGNLEAMRAVMEDIKAKGIEKILCLGDIIGYGPNPRECLLWSLNLFSFSLIGNHEEAVMLFAEDFNDKARAAVDWTRNQLSNRDKPREENRACWNYLDKMKKTVEQNDMLFVHGSPRIPTREYILPQDVDDISKMEQIFELITRICFVGHTHVPGIFFRESDEAGYRFVHSAKLKNAYKFVKGHKIIINVGSVGQPRDNDTRACYLTLAGDGVEWHRVEYPLEVTAKKIRAIDELPDYLADRLLEGR